MAYLANLYKERGFIRLHYTGCSRAPHPQTDYFPERKVSFETLQAVEQWRDAEYPNHEFRTCSICQPIGIV